MATSISNTVRCSVLMFVVISLIVLFYTIDFVKSPWQHLNDMVGNLPKNTPNTFINDDLFIHNHTFIADILPKERLESMSKNYSGVASYGISFLNKLNNEHQSYIGILILCYNKAKYLPQIFDSIISSLLSTNDPSKYKIIVSQQYDNPYNHKNSYPVTATLMKYVKIIDLFYTHQHKKEWNMGERVGANVKLSINYCFTNKKYNITELIIVEDDLIMANDCLNYFENNIYLLYDDPTIWCLSAYNQLGQVNFTTNKTQLYRSDYFQSLIWMIAKHKWNESSSRVTLNDWEADLSRLNVNYGRSVVYPEISRSLHIAHTGLHVREDFFQTALNTINFDINTNINWKKINTNYLIKENYDKYWMKILSKSTNITLNELLHLEGDKMSDEYYKIHINKNELIDTSKKIGFWNTQFWNYDRGLYTINYTTACQIFKWKENHTIILYMNYQQQHINELKNYAKIMQKS